MERWINRVALVTGAAGGMASAISRSLVRHGMIVYGCDINTEQLEKMAKELDKEKGQFFPVKCDMQDEAEILSMFKRIKEQHRGVDVCLSTCGILNISPLLEGPTTKWRKMYEINVLAQCIVAREAIKQMREHGVDDGHVIFMNSVLGHIVLPLKNFHFYSATKFASRALAEGFRQELRELGSSIRISSIYPSATNTPLVDRIHNEPKYGVDWVDFKILDPKDVAASVEYMLAAPAHVLVHGINISAIRDTY